MCRHRLCLEVNVDNDTEHEPDANILGFTSVSNLVIIVKPFAAAIIVVKGLDCFI